MLHDHRRIVGLLTERDLVAARRRLERVYRRFDELTVADALSPDALNHIVCIAPDMPRKEVVEAWTCGGVITCLVTPEGSLDAAPLGIITHADLLYRMQGCLPEKEPRSRVRHRSRSAA
ncbi:CBS domain-containing protein [Roseiflexus castenholzii]|uniref:hypothetical protein n=1 Tax=Roseiflexus castenholzii TaxID=120962 RepID=UPI0012ED4283|nr:hypothetical protein [Roseiflexus castenholzii]